jgi:hypothetical protein
MPIILLNSIKCKVKLSFYIPIPKLTCLSISETSLGFLQKYGYVLYVYDVCKFTIQGGELNIAYKARPLYFGIGSQAQLKAKDAGSDKK